MIAFPLRRMQSLITRNDLLWAITVASLHYCNVLKVHFWLLAASTCERYCAELLISLIGSFYFVFNYVKAN